MGPDGVLAFGLGHYENFAGPELARLLSCARRTLQGAFAHVVLVPRASSTPPPSARAW
jgi:hypothetical protein